MLALLIHNAGGRFALTATNVASQQAFSSHDTASILFLMALVRNNQQHKKRMLGVGS
jgi:hypothetical protein